MRKLLKRAYHFLFNAEVTLSSVVVRVRYWHLIEAGKSCTLGRGVVIKPTWPRDSQSLTKVILGTRVRVGSFTTFQGSGQVLFGDRSYCGTHCFFGTNDRILIGRDVLISDFVSFRDSDHVVTDISLPMNRQGIVASCIVVEDDVWIGHGAVILKGVRIGRGAVVGAGAVVTRDVPPLGVAAGVPAGIIRIRAKEARGQR